MKNLSKNEIILGLRYKIFVLKFILFYLPDSFIVKWKIK